MMQKLLFLGGMLLALLTGNAVYAYDFKVDDICYTVTSFENYTVTVDGLKDNKVYYFKIAALKNGKPGKKTSSISPAATAGITIKT